MENLALRFQRHTAPLGEVRWRLRLRNRLRERHQDVSRGSGSGRKQKTEKAYSCLISVFQPCSTDSRYMVIVIAALSHVASTGPVSEPLVMVSLNAPESLRGWSQ